VIFEINTGAMSRGYRSAPYPALWLLRAMEARDIPICITSDCHRADALLYAFDQAEELARSCGYRERMVLTRRGFQPVGI
jgi:histidinol-phosphatase (PHP family)